MKVKSFIKNNIIGFVIGALLFGGIGTVVATTILSSSVSYTNNDQTTVEGALNELYGMVNIACYNGTCGKLAFRYWKINSSQIGETLNNALPTPNYKTRALLEENYGVSNFANNPIYIRTALIDGNPVEHQVCLWYSNKEFCMSQGYWAGTIGITSTNAGTQTKLKIQRDMQNAFGITIPDSSCGSDSRGAGCDVGDFFCDSYCSGGGEVSCRSNSTNEGCRVFDGVAVC